MRSRPSWILECSALPPQVSVNQIAGDRWLPSLNESIFCQKPLFFLCLSMDHCMFLSAFYTLILLFNRCWSWSIEKERTSILKSYLSWSSISVNTQGILEWLPAVSFLLNIQPLISAQRHNKYLINVLSLMRVWFWH